VARLAGRREIADTTISIPHPLSEEQARDWIAARTGRQNAARKPPSPVTLKDTGRLIGTVGLREINREHSHAELGLWIGVDWWGQGYATEAARALIRFAFEQPELNRVYAHHMVRNPASGRVLERIGMKRRACCAVRPEVGRVRGRRDPGDSADGVVESDAADTGRLTENCRQDERDEPDWIRPFSETSCSSC